MAGNTTDKRVNDQRLRGMPEGGTLTESLTGRGTGSILFKKVGPVITAYYRWNLNKRPGQLSISPYKATPSSTGLSLAEIREKARELVGILLAHGNPKDYLAQQEAAVESQRQVEAKAKEAESKLGTFQDLLDYYTADLKARGRVKAREITRMFEMHVIEPFPELAAKPARDVVVTDISRILLRVLNSKPRNRGKNNTTKAPATSMRSTTDTLHTYLSAAFENAKTSMISLESNIEDPKDFGVTFNAAAAVKTLTNVYMGDTESLQQAELRELLIYLHDLPTRQRAIALAPIYLGGQRLKMLAPLQWQDMHEDGILLVDKKGNAPPRNHFLPLTPRIRNIMEPLLEFRLSDKGPFATSKNLAGSDYITKLYSTAGKKLSESGKTRYFSWKNVRVTTETLMAGLGISEETRAHLLSHGRTGIQAKHYDRNAYLREKTQALETWSAYLDDLMKGQIRTDIKVLTLAQLRSGLADQK
jgi:hypothetical protein